MDTMALVSQGARSSKRDGEGGMGTAALLEIARELADAYTEHEIAEIVTGRIFDAVRADAGAAYIVSEDGAYADLVALRGRADTRSANRMSLDTELPLPVCIRQGEPIFVSNRDEMIARFPALTETLRAPSAKRIACVCLPLRCGEKSVGGIAFGFDHPRPFDADERAF